MSSPDNAGFAVTADVVVFAQHEGQTRVLLVKRANEPFKGRWGLPGGFVEIDEDLADAARRELAEETGVEVDVVRQLGAYGTPGRDPRMRVVTVAFWTEVDPFVGHQAADDAGDTRFWAVADLLADPNLLAFDHHLILRDALVDLRGNR